MGQLNDGMQGSLGGSPLFNTEIGLFDGSPDAEVQHQVVNGSKIIFDTTNKEFYIQDDATTGSAWNKLRLV
jgi:hypothetical protein